MAQQPYRVRVTDKANPAAQRAIEYGLSQYNREKAGYADARNLSVLVSDSASGEVAGGLLGRTSLGIFSSIYSSCLRHCAVTASERR